MFAASSAPVTSAASSAAAPASSRPQLSDALFKKFADIVYDISGMRFESSKAYFLSSKVDTRVQALGLSGFQEYLTYLESPSGRPEYGHLVDEVTINETFFFRHEPQLQALRDGLLQQLVFQRKNQRQMRFRIWSCAASTGDELYTMALMLMDMGLAGPGNPAGIQFELIGTDISHDALEKARAGVYRKYNIRNVPPALLQKHFTHNPGNDTWTINSDIKAMCRFQEGNLMDAARCGLLGKFDIMFCRNVLIYFDEPSKEQVVKNLANALADDGYALLGHSENIYGQRHLLRPDKVHTAAIAYVKAPPGTPKL